jgi:LacI family transcriptional regulator
MSKDSSVTIRDVAAQAGVSVATVSRYINQNTPVSPEVAARLEAVMAKLHYIPNAVARKLATHKTHTIGLLFNDMHGDFFAPLLAGVEEITSTAGFDLLISSAHTLLTHKTNRPSLGPHNTDGLLVFTGSLDETWLLRFHEKKFPLVLIHRSSPADAPIPCVTVENKSASCLLVEHLITAHRRRRIVFLNGPGGEEDSAWREIGYRQALLRHAIPFDPALLAPGGFDRRVAQASISSLLAAGLQFDAVFASDDESAVGVLAALQQAGKRVPEDIAVVGFDDQRMSPYLNPPLTTVRAPTAEVGRRAASLLISLIETGQAELLTLLPTEIIIRRSCGCTQSS